MGDEARQPGRVGLAYGPAGDEPVRHRKCALPTNGAPRPAPRAAGRWSQRQLRANLGAMT